MHALGEIVNRYSAIPSDFSIEVSDEMVFPTMPHTNHPVRYGRKMSRNASAGEGHEGQHSK
jgi:hypothetical protein